MANEGDTGEADSRAMSNNQRNRVRKVERKLRVHCTQHRILFEVLDASTLVCDADGHALAHNFPFGEWWEFCCYCQTFWPSDAEHGGTGREHCPACEQPLGTRYLCHRCMVLSNAPKAAPKGRGFRISVVGRVDPCCPGCYRVAPPVIDHQCDGARKPFATARPLCPFCEEVIWEDHAGGESQGGRPFDEVQAGEASAAAGVPFLKSPDDVLEDWLPWEDTGVGAESDSPPPDLLGEVGPSEDDGWQVGPVADGLLNTEGDAAEVVFSAPEISEADTHVRVSEVGAAAAAVTVAKEPTSTAVTSRTLMSTDGTPGGESRNEERAFLSQYTAERRARWVSPKGVLLLIGAVAVAFIIVALLWPHPPADGDASAGAAVTPAGAGAGDAGRDTHSSPTPPEGMVYVPGGPFKMGRDDGDNYERPAHGVKVDPFYIDQFELTCEQYQRFVEEKHHKAPPGWRNGKYPDGWAKLPVTGVSWEDASAYAKWLGKRLPTEAEWEFAARGADERRYPWGDDWDPLGANAEGSGPGRPTEVGLHPRGASPFEVQDMAGNVWEWTADSIRPYEGGTIPEDKLSPDARNRLKVIRGGCYLSDARSANTTYRRGWPANGADYTQTGFRCARDVGPQVTSQKR
jgi:formylglycine-generating enzyme required for sulfatase activity